MGKPYSQACENNKQPILDVIKNYFENTDSVLEIGSGTGQHAVYFAEHLPHLTWQTSDKKENHPGINAWIDDYSGDNLLRPIDLDVTNSWPVTAAKGIYSANTAHIMSWPMVESFFSGVGRVLKANGYFCLYGPFNFCGEYTSESNKDFDHYLQSQDPEMGIRDFVDIEEQARKADLFFIEKHTMPANNFLLVWQKSVILNKTVQFD
ncbi:DUF938 domain-containing protein [Pleionea sediminis]|uniref:DUF938 domain-containing protein n=1 Tax=Pleionea sediminis TaxID=2569479 RepID=UPI0011858259|nr:DUF938 domain-containing protein [Pleionea sediminis]